MTRKLDVYLHDDLIGLLIQDDGGQMMFTYLPAWVDNPTSTPLSHSLPLRPEQFSQKECQGFFGGLLPEGTSRHTIASLLGISKENDFSMLNEIGGECAGAVTFMPHGIQLPNKNFGSEPIPESKLADILKNLPVRPLMITSKVDRISLAGAQYKIAVRIDEGEVSRPLGSSPSTHILKPENPIYRGLVYNEALCMKLAEKIGMNVAKVTVGKAEKTEYLAVKRYDRKDIPISNIINGYYIFSKTSYKVRLHQEDFCQALGVSFNKKYQYEGGPSIKNCFDLIRSTSETKVQDLQNFLDAILFNYLIGNCDAHAKNYSLLYNKGHTALTAKPAILMAPLYDLVSTNYYEDHTTKMAMKIGDQYHSNLVTTKDFEKMAEECGLSKPLVKKRVVEMAQKIITALEKRIVEHPIADKVSQVIKSRCLETIESFHA